MECSIGLCLNDFLMVATDRTNARSILVMKDGKFKLIQGCIDVANYSLDCFRNKVVEFLISIIFKTNKNPTNCRISLL